MGKFHAGDVAVLLPGCLHVAENASLFADFPNLSVGWTLVPVDGEGQPLERWHD
jgi:hypothetical protein